MNNIKRKIFSILTSAIMVISATPVISVPLNTLSANAASISSTTQPHITLTTKSTYVPAGETVEFQLRSDQYTTLRTWPSNFNKAYVVQVKAPSGMILNDNEFNVAPNCTYTISVYCWEAGNVTLNVYDTNNVKQASKELTIEHFYIAENRSSTTMQQYMEAVKQEYNRLPISYRNFLQDHGLHVKLYDKQSLSSTSTVYGLSSWNEINLCTGCSPQFSTIHEVAHSLHYMLGNESLNNTIQTIFDKHKNGYHFMYNHAYDNAMEYFAEAVRYYYYTNYQGTNLNYLLKTYDPEMYNLIDDMMSNPKKYFQASTNKLILKVNSATTYTMSSIPTSLNLKVGDRIRAFKQIQTPYIGNNQVYVQSYDDYVTTLNITNNDNNVIFNTCKVDYTFKTAGIYNVSVQLTYGNAVYQNYTFKVNVSGLKNESYLSCNETAMKNTTCTMYGQASNVNGNVKYEYYYKTSKQSQYIQCYPINPAFVSVKLTEIGTYNFKIRAIDNSGQTVDKDMTVKVTESQLQNTSTVSSTEIALGQTTSINCHGKNAYGQLEHTIKYKLSGDSTWTTLTSLKKDQTVSFMPKKAGKYLIQVITSDQTKIISKSFELQVEAMKNTSTISNTQIPLEEPVLIHLKTQNGFSPFTYNITAQRQGDNQVFTIANNYTGQLKRWVPPEKGIYTITVTSKDNQGNIAQKTMQFSTDKTKNVSSLSSNQIYLGESINVNIAGKYIGGGHLYTKLFIKSPRDSEAVEISINDANAYVYTPRYEGQYTIITKISRDGKTFIRKSLTLNVLNMQNTSTLSKRTANTGDSVEIIPSSKYGYKIRKIKVEVLKPGEKEYQLVLNGTPCNVPYTLYKSGTYAFRITLRDRFENTATVVRTIKVNGIQNLTTINKSVFKCGEAVVFTPKSARALQTAADVTYIIYVKTPGSKTYKQIAITKQGHTIKYVLKTKGKYDFKVLAQDCVSNKDSKTFTVDVL